MANVASLSGMSGLCGEVVEEEEGVKHRRVAKLILLVLLNINV